MKEKLFFTLSLVLLVAVSAAAGEVRISAAASLNTALGEIVHSYQHSYPQIGLVPNFASSGALAKQIVAGAPADIYISANPKWMAYLQEQGMIAEASVMPLVSNALVFVGLRPVGRLAELGQLERIALGSPTSTPVGRYTEQALQNAGMYAQLQAGQKLILAKDVRQALLYADRGEVEGAFVYRTDALLARQAQLQFVVPQQLYPQVVYPAALTKIGRENPAAAEFFDYLFSEPVRQIFAKFGFIVDR